MSGTTGARDGVKRGGGKQRMAGAGDRIVGARGAVRSRWHDEKNDGWGCRRSGMQGAEYWGDKVSRTTGGKGGAKGGGQTACLWGQGGQCGGSRRAE